MGNEIHQSMQQYYDELTYFSVNTKNGYCRNGDMQHLFYLFRELQDCIMIGNSYQTQSDKLDAIDSVKLAIKYKIFDAILGCKPGMEPTESKMIESYSKTGMIDSTTLNDFLYFYRQAKSLKRIYQNIDIVSKRFDIKRMLNQYMVSPTEGSEYIPDERMAIILPAMMRLFSTYSLSQEELCCFTTEIYSVMTGGRFYSDAFYIFHRCLWFLYLCMPDKDRLSKGYKQLATDAAYIMDQSIYFKTVDKVEFGLTIYKNEITKYLMEGNQGYVTEEYPAECESDIPSILKELYGHSILQRDHMQSFYWFLLPFLCIYSPYVESEDGKRNNWKVIQDLLDPKEFPDEYRSRLQAMIDLYSHLEIHMLSDFEKRKKEKMVMMLKDALKRYLTEEEIHEEMKKEIAPVIDPKKDRRELGFNEEEEKVLNGFAILGDALNYATEVDIASLEDVFTFDNEKAVNHESVVDFVTNFSLNNPKLLDPLLVANRLKNGDRDGSIALNTVIKDCIYKLNESVDYTEKDSPINFLDVQHIDDMMPAIQEMSKELYVLGDDLHMMNAIANLDQMDEADAEAIISNMDQKYNEIKKSGKIQSGFAAFREKASKLGEIVKDASDMTDPNDKNTFLKTRVVPQIKAIFGTVIATIGATWIIGPFIGLLTLAVGLFITQNVGTESKQALVNELETELSMIDRRIEKAKADGNDEEEKNLRLLKKKMQVQYAKLEEDNKKNHKLIMKNDTSNEKQKSSSSDDDWD